MAGFIDWFERTAPGGTEPLPALTRAGAAHLYFETIHPFEDGNGRIGRAIAEKSLAQSLGQPTLIVLAATILARRASYYHALEAASQQNEITDWLAWFAGITIEAQQRTLALIEFLIDKAKLFDRLKGQLNDRQQKALLRMFKEGPDGFKGGLGAGKYGTITAHLRQRLRVIWWTSQRRGRLCAPENSDMRATIFPCLLKPVAHMTIGKNGELSVEAK